MDEARPGETLVEIRASAFLRWGAIVGVSFCVYMLCAPWHAKTEFFRWFRIVGGLVLVPFSGWLAYTYWRRPLLRLGPQGIGIVGSETVPVSEVVRYRWPAPRDLWIDRRNGPPVALPIGAIGAKDRERVRAWLAARWTDGGLLGER